MKKNTKIEKKIYELLGVKLFRKYIIFTIDKALNLFHLTIPGYHLMSKNIKGLKRQKVASKCFALFHLIYLYYLCFNSHALLAIIINIYCIMLQRYTHIRINAMLERFEEKKDEPKTQELSKTERNSKKLIKSKERVVKHNTLPDLHVLTETTQWLDNEFLLYPNYFYKKLDTLMTDITMNTSSELFLQKAEYCKTPSAIFLESLINLFQALECSTNEKPIYYHAHTQPLVIYCLRILARHEIIKTIDLKKDDKKSSFPEDYFEALGQNPKTNKFTMYDIVFIKLRPLCENDLKIIKHFEAFLHIEESTIRYSDDDGILSAQLNIQTQKTEGNCSRSLVNLPKKS